MNSRSCVAALTCAALFLFALSAAAQAPEGQTEAAKAVFEKGKALFDAGKFAEAANAFREADRLQHAWKLLYNIGQCEMMTKRHSLALEAFERYLSEGGGDIDSARRDQVLAEVVRLREMVGFADVRAPDGAVVTVDDVERGSTPLPGPIAVDAGVEHRVLAMKNNVAVLNRVVRVSGGQTLVVEAESGAPAEIEEPTPAPEAVAKPGAPGPNPRAVWGWTAVGVGAAAVIAGAVTGSLALSKNSDIKDNCTGGNCLPAWHDEVDKRDRLALATDVLLPTGAAVAVVGVLLLTVFKGEEQAAVTASRDGFMIGGRF
jgi:hypothetical protein